MSSFGGYNKSTAKYLQYEPADEEDEIQVLDGDSDRKEISPAQVASKFSEIFISDWLY